jgi:hypothetical protein
LSFLLSETILLYAIVHASEIGYFLLHLPGHVGQPIMEHFPRGGLRKESLGTLDAWWDLGGYYHLTGPLRGLRKIHILVYGCENFVSNTMLKGIWDSYPRPRFKSERYVCVRVLFNSRYLHIIAVLSLPFRCEEYKMANPGSGSRNFPIGGMGEHAQTSPDYGALRLALGRASGLLSSGAGPTNVTPTRADIPLTSVEKGPDPTDSVYFRSTIPAKTDESFRMNPSPVTVGFGQEDGWRGMRRSQSAELERKDRQAQNLPDPAFDNLLNRLQWEYIGREENEETHASRDNALAGTFRYLPSTHIQESSGGVPEKFQPGRESLSVVRNITIRDSKRTKSRTKDDDYKRRVSISSSIGTLAPDRRAVGTTLPYHQQRLGQSISALTGIGISPTPLPANGGGVSTRCFVV